MAFFGIIIAMGIAKLPEINDYWRTRILRMPWFGSIMSRNHFKVILRFLHLADNSKQLPRNDKGHDRPFKLGNMPKILSQRFSEQYSPKCSLSIDEQMIGTKARISFLQYMPKKPKKFGIKLCGFCKMRVCRSGKMWVCRPLGVWVPCPHANGRCMWPGAVCTHKAIIATFYEFPCCEV